MTLLLPGSAQLAAGNKSIGKIALRIWAAVVMVIVALAVVVLAWRGVAITLAANQVVLTIAQILLVLLGLGWGLLLVDAWRLSRPPELARRHRMVFAGFSLGLAVVIMGGGIASASVVSAQRDLIGSMFAGGGNTKAVQGRYNIMLLGGDAGAGRVGLRPDSITVASVDAVTGRVVLLGLPRNLEGVPFPADSPMHKEFPQGFRCANHACMLNAIYTYASQHPQLYPGVRDPGVKATQEAVEATTGLKINYYAMIDLNGFSSLIDAVGGITMDINQRVPMGGHGRPVFGYIEAGKNVHLDGFHALWFARSRVADSDYQRMARQKCVMRAMLNQLDPVTVLSQWNKIAKAGKEIMETNVPTSDINTLLNLAMLAKSKPISYLSFTPPLINPGAADFALIRQTVATKITAAARADQPKPSRMAGSTSRPGGSSTAAKKASAGGPTSARATAGQDSLDNICAVH